METKRQTKVPKISICILYTFDIFQRDRQSENQDTLTISLPCFSVQIKHKNYKNTNSVQQLRGHLY